MSKTHKKLTLFIVVNLGSFYLGIHFNNISYQNELNYYRHKIAEKNIRISNLINKNPIGY